MQKIIVTKTYHCLPFDQLDESIKQIVRERYGDWNVNYEWWDSVYNDFAYDRAEEGVTVDLKKTFFSGFWSQGDGAAFSANLDEPEKWITQYVDEEYRRVLLHIINYEYWYASTGQSGRYYNQASDLEADNPHESHCYYRKESTGPGPYDYRYKAYGRQAKAYDFADEAIEYFRNAWEEYCDNKANELYANLEREYEYLTSDECLKESFYDRVFDIETGEMFDGEIDYAN